MKKLILSASQLKTAETCLRKWWYERVAKLPQIRGDQFGFGTVLHAVIEKYLLGKPEEMFAEGWDIDPDTGKRINPADAQLISVLVEKGIDEGVIERRPGSVVEQEFRLEVDPETEIMGYIDHEDFDLVEDHKTSKSRRYLLSSKALTKDMQMMLYGKKKVEEHRKTGVASPPVVGLVHNQFLKDYDEPTVRKARGEVTPHQIDEFWRNTILPLISKIKAAKKVTNPFDIPDPPPSACNAYGGCPFMSLCSHGEGIEVYTKRINTMIQRAAEKVEPSMSIEAFKERRRLAQAAAAGAAAAPSVNPPAPAKPAAPPAPAPAANPAPTVSADGKPPWFSVKCAICTQPGRANPGFSSLGQPCKGCLINSGVKADGFKWQKEADGRITWWKDGDAIPVAQIPPPKAEVVKAREVVAEPEPVEEEVEEVPEEAVPEPAPVAEPEKPRRGRPRKAPQPADEAPEALSAAPAPASAPIGNALLVLVNCAPNVPLPGRTVVSAEQWLAKADGYYAEGVSAFDRRDRLRERLLKDPAGAAAQLQDIVLTATVPDPDVVSLISTLAALPGTVVIHGPR